MTRLLFTTSATGLAPGNRSGSRRRWGARLSGLALAAAFLCAALPAQQPATPAAKPAQAPAAQQPAAQQAGARPGGSGTDVGVTTLRTNVNEVNLIFTVTDKHGHYIPNLQQSDFALLDDQKAPERVNSFHQQINLPLRVGIVIDTSTSIRSRFQFEQQSATEFLSADSQGQEATAPS